MADSAHHMMTDTTSSPSYPGEDTTPTTNREIHGFYAYSFAAEVFVVCGLGAFIPITLEELAESSTTAVLAKDHSKPCKAIEAATHRLLSSRDGITSNGADGQCVFTIFGREMNTASFALYTFSISVLIQALLVVTMSGIADHGQYRKSMMLGFGFIGAATTMLFLTVTPNVYLFGSLWAIVSNVCFGASAVLLNTFLPLLVRNHPTILDRKTSGTQDQASSSAADNVDDSDILDSTAALLPERNAGIAASRSAPIKTSNKELQLSTQISSNGVAIGYIAAVTVQITAILILVATGQSLLSLKLVLLLVGAWWFVFMIPAAMWLRPRPGAPLPLISGDKKSTWLGYVIYSWTNLVKTMIRARRLRDVLLFLAAWFLISDGISTISGTAILFAKKTLGMKPSALAMINVVTVLCGVVGAITWSTISTRFQLRPVQTILTCICLFELIPLYGLLGYVPFIKSLGVFGLQQQWEMYPLGAVYGLVLGGLSSYCRSLYGELIPPGSEAAFFALYAITDKGSSIFGPAIVGAITDSTGDIRPAFIFLSFLIGLPIPLMMLVNVERGKREAAALAKEMNALKISRHVQHNAPAHYHDESVAIER